MRVWFAILLLVPLAGCTDTTEGSVLGSRELIGSFPSYKDDLLEMRLNGGEWGGSRAAVAFAPGGEPTSPQFLETDRSGVVDAEWTTYAVDVRFRSYEDLGDVEIAWFAAAAPNVATVEDADELVPWLYAPENRRQTMAGSEHYAFAFDAVGVYAIGAAVVDGTRMVGYVAEAVVISASGAWGFVDDARPLRPSGTDPQPGLGNARDIFRFPVATAPTYISATTQYDDGQPWHMGTDVDVGLFNPDGSWVLCEGSGGSGTGFDPTQAEEEIVATDLSQVGAYEVWVGAMDDGCNDQTWQYVNAGSVPYTVEVHIRYD